MCRRKHGSENDRVVMKKLIPFLFAVAITSGLFSICWSIGSYIIYRNSPEKLSGVIQIKGSMWSGSGFIVSKDGLIITAGHVLDGLWDGTVELEDGTVIDIDPNSIYIDRSWDVGICRTTDYENTEVFTFCSDTVDVGTEIWISGFPLGLEKWASFGHVARKSSKGTIYIDCDANPGNSGCPIFCGDGKVVGLITGGYEITDISFGVGVEAIRNVLERYEVLYESP